MSILVDTQTRILVQGITGKEGSRAAKSMQTYGAHIVAGVSPGKGGTDIEGVPVYNTVAEACSHHPDVNASLIVVPARFVEDAAGEAIGTRIPLINILSEGVSVLSVARLIYDADAAGSLLVGPSSIGIISPGKSKIGSIGSDELDKRVFTSGPVGVVSKSGGMTAELSRILSESGIGQSTALGIGGDVLIGADFLRIAELFEQDDETHALVVFGEVGGVYELKLARAIKEERIAKPVVALIAGVFSETLPYGIALGHAGAIASGGRESASAKIESLREAGALIARTPEEIPALLRQVL